MRIILFIVFYIATCVARIAIAGDISRTMSRRSRRYFRQKSETARSGVSEMPVDDGIIRMINKRDKQSLLGNRIDGFPQIRRSYNLERVKRSLQKRKKRCAKNSNCKLTRRRSNYDIEQNISSNVASFPIWRVPESTVSAINFESTTIMEAEMNNRSLLTPERPPSQLENLNYGRAVNEAVFPIAERYPSSRGLFDINVSDKDTMLPKIANPKSEIKVDVLSPAFEGLDNKIPLPAYRPGTRANIASPNSSYPQGIQRHGVHRRNSANEYNVKEELFNDRLASSNKRFLLVPVSRNIYVLKNVQENPRAGVDGIIPPKRYKLLEGDKDNATSAILSFKAHMHHDAKDVGRAYLQRGNHRLLDRNEYLYSTLDPRAPEETANPTENPASYPNFLYRGVSFQTHTDLIDATPEISDEQIFSPVPDYANVSVDVNLRGGIESYDSAGFLSSSSSDIPNYDVISKESANDGQLSVLSATKLDNEISLFQQDGGNYENPLKYGEFGIELTTADFRDTFDDNVYTPAAFEMYLTNNEEMFDVSQNLGDDSKFSTERIADEPVTDFIDNISTQYKFTNEDNVFFPNIAYNFADNAEDLLNGEDIDKDSQEHGISIPDEYDNKKSIYSNNFDYDNRAIDEALLGKTTNIDLFLNAGDYVTAASLFPSTDEWPLKKAQSNVENSRALLMAIKPLSSELQKLLNAVKLVNRSLSDVQSRLCDKKNVVRTERESEDRKAANIAKLTNKVDDSDLFTESFNSQSPEKRRIKFKNRSIAERDIKIRGKTSDLFLNKLTTLFHKRKSSISNSEVQSARGNFLEKRKLNEREFPKSGERRRLTHSRFNRNLKSLMKNYGMRVKPTRQLIEPGLKRTKRTTTSIMRPSRLIKSNVSSEKNFSGGYARNHQGSNQMSRSIISSSNIQDQQRNVKRAMPSEISRSDKEKQTTDPQFFTEATAYVDVLQLLGKTEKPHVEYATDVWGAQSLTESLPSLIFTTTEFSVSALTFLPYFTEESITTLSTIAEKKEAPEMTESSLYKYVTDFRDYIERNYTRYKDYEEITSEIMSLTESPVTWSAFTITMPTTLPLFYMTELTILPIDEAAILTTEKMTIISPFMITTEVTETPIVIPMIENFTTESAMILTPFLEGITNITLKIKIPAATEAPIKETPMLIEVETVTEEETVESTSTLEIMRSLPVETDTSLYTFSTESLFKTIETELTIKITSPTVVPTTLTITKGFQTVTMESIFGKPFYSTTAIASSPTILERTEMILSTSTEVAITTLTLEEESPVTQIEKTITAEETATEIPTTVETETPTEVTLSTTKTSITATEIPTSTETTRITEILKINKTAETPTSIETPTTSERSTSTEATTITETLTPTEILTTLKTSITKETTGAKTLTPEIKTTIETLTTTEISTSIETKIITEMSTINKTLITAKTPTAFETPTASERPTSTEIITFTETVTPTEFLTTLTTLVTKGITSAKTLTPTETSIETEITTETSTTTEISTETTTITETLTTTGTSAFTETSTTSEIPTTSTTIAEITGITEISALTEIVTTIKIPTTKKTTSTEALTPTVVETLSTTETQMITETPTFTETSETTEITVISTTHITTEFITISENTTSSVATTASKEVFSTSVLTIFPTTFTSETATESTLISSITPTLAVTTSGKIAVSTLKLTMTTLLETLITNATLSETAYTTISSTFTTTERSVITSFETAMSTTSLKVATTMPLSLITSTMLSETPSSTLSTILTEETTASSILTMSSLEMVQTTTILPISITESTMETFLTTSSIATYTTGNATVSSTTASIITTEIFESTSPVMNFTVTTPSITTIPITTPVIVDTGTTTYETSASVTSFLLTETTEGMTSPTREETKEYEEYYESTKEEIATVTSTTELTTEEYTTWITEVTITRERTTYLPSFTTPFFIRSTTETTPLAIETITLPTTTEETLSTEKIVTVTPVTTIEGISTFSEVTLIPTETSTMSVIETSSLVPTIAATIASLPEETVTEVTETSWIITTLLPTTERPEYSTILEAAVAVTLAPFSESILSILITLETPATTPEVISVLPRTISEEFTISITESPSIKYVTESSIISFIETTVHPIVSISTAITEETLEAETEYYTAKGPSYEEEYEEYEEYEGYDTEIPTGKWYYYDEYETTTKERTTATVKYTKLPEEKAKSPPFVTGTTSYEIETSEFTRYSTPSEITTYVTSTARTFYTEEEVTSALETSASTIIENVTTIEARTEFTMSASEKTESTTWLSFGSTEEYTLPSSTTVRISTEPLEYLTITPKYTAVERFTHIWRNITLPKFTTKPKKIPEIILEKTTASEGVSTETEVAEKLTSFFVSPALTTLTEKEAFEVHTTTMSTASLETEGIIKTGYEVTTLAMTEEETIFTPFITSEAELIFTTTSKTIARDEQKEQLLQQLDELKKHEKELAEREERLKEQQKQWGIEKEKCQKIMHEKEEAKNITTLTPYITTSIMDFYSIGLTSIETATPYTVEEMYTTSYVTLFSEPLFAPLTITSPITSTTEKFTLPIVTFSETFEEASIALITTPTWYTTEEIYTATYTDIYKPFFTLPTLEFTSTTTPPTLAIVTATEIKYDEEIERLKEKLRKKERELEEREKILREREKRLDKGIMEFEKYIEEFKKKVTSVTSAKKSTIFTSLSTPAPPTERTTVKVQLTTQKITEKKESRTTTKMVTSRQTEMKDIQEKKRTKYIPEEAVTQKEEEIATKRICLNVMENTTIPLDKRRNIVTRKICLPYYPEKTEQKRSVGRLSRRLLALQSTRKIRRPRWNVPSDIRCRRRVKETTRKIDNLQLSHHEWLSNETTKPLRHFKGFTRIYGKMRKFPKKVAAITDMRENTTRYFKDKTSLYEQRILDHYENIFQPTATPMLDSKEYRKRNTFFEYDLISRKSNFPIDDKANVRKRDVSTIDNARFSRKITANTSSQRTTPAIIEEDGFFTVNVLHLIYNEDKQTHEVVSAKPDEDELTAILSESNDNYVTDFGEDRKIITPYEIEEEDNLKEDDDELADKTKKKMEDEDYIEDMIDNYMNYEEHETSTWTHNKRFLNDKGKNKRITENERKLLNQAWPTEKSTTFHLGGTQFWELDFVTEPSAVLRTTIDKSKTINVSITETTCFDVILKNERNDEVKSNISYHKRDVHRKNVSIEQRNANLRNVTRKNASRYELRTKLPRVPATKLKQKPHGSNYSKRNYDGRRAAKFNDFRRTGNEDSITGKSRKLCGVNANKLNREIVKHKDATDKHKKKQAAKSRMLRNINSHSLRNTDNCVANKKNKCKKMTTASPQMKKTHDKKSHGKVTHLNIIDYKHKPTSASHGRKIHNCLDCICDIANVINNIKSLLDRMSFPLDKIKALNCSEYKEIQDKIVISMESDVEEAREFPQPHYNVESLKGQKYIKLEELEDNFKNDLELDGDHDVVSLPGLNLNLPCNQDGDGITWLSSVIRPSYTWKRTDGVALFGFVAENGDLELRNVNAKDTGNYTCVVTYMSPDNEEPVEATYEIHLQVVTLPRYVVHGEGRYHVRSCDERDLDILVTYLPLKLNSVICETDICNAYVLAPSCSQNQITVNILLVPSHIVKLMTIDSKHCNVFCLKAIQDKLSLVLSKNLQIFLGKIIIFRLPHYEQRLVPIAEESSFTRRKRGKIDANASVGRASNVGVFSSCPAGYGLRDTRCVPCNMGTYSEDGISHCKRCPPGTYQPNHGARVCRTCTNPMTKGCYNMLWNSFSAVMVTLASVGVMVLICLLLLWIICCAKKKFCVKRIAGIVAKEDAFEPEKRVEEQPLIRDASENEDQQWDSEYKIKRKKGKFYVNKKRRKQNERRKYDKMRAHEDEWESHRIKNARVIYPDSYQSHEDYNNCYPKQSYHKGPRLPECDFDT